MKTSRRQFLASALGFTLAVPLVARAAQCESPPVFIGVDRCEPGVPDRCVVTVSSGGTTKTFEIPWGECEWSFPGMADA